MHQSWSDFYQKYGRFYLKPHEFFNRVVSRFKTFDIHNSLDLGCGSGRHCIALSEKGVSVTGVDFSPSAIELARTWARTKGLHVDLIIADIHEHIVGINDASFDSVVAINTLEYSTKGQFEKTISEVNRILKDGGLFWLVVPSKDSTKNKVADHLVFDENEIKAILAKTFRVLEFSKDSQMNFSILAQEK